VHCTPGNHGGIERCWWHAIRERGAYGRHGELLGAFQTIHSKSAHRAGWLALLLLLALLLEHYAAAVVQTETGS
jgi:hypothetical protein